VSPVTRRVVLLGGAAMLSGCAAQETGRPSATPSTTPSTATPPVAKESLSGAPSGTPTPSAPVRARPWRPGPAEVRPEAKVAACRAVERLGQERGRRTTVVYPQYGGLLTSSACVMVLADQEWDEEGSLRRRELTVDVRLRQRARAWSVVSTREHADSCRRPPTGMAAALLSEPRLDIRGVAAADLAAGRVDPLVERALLRLGRDHHLSVSVFATGHPWEVFGTTGMSNHTRGRAVDVWAVDGRLVAGMPADDPALTAVLRRARELGSDEIGGPIDLDGLGGAHFANALHRDHIHIGFDTGSG
jgi:hypothetical protein